MSASFAQNFLWIYGRSILIIFIHKVRAHKRMYTCMNAQSKLHLEHRKICMHVCSCNIVLCTILCSTGIDSLQLNFG